MDLSSTLCTPSFKLPHRSQPPGSAPRSRDARAGVRARRTRGEPRGAPHPPTHHDLGGTTTSGRPGAERGHRDRGWSLARRHRDGARARASAPSPQPQPAPAQGEQSAAGCPLPLPAAQPSRRLRGACRERGGQAVRGWVPGGAAVRCRDAPTHPRAPPPSRGPTSCALGNERAERRPAALNRAGAGPPTASGAGPGRGSAVGAPRIRTWRRHRDWIPPAPYRRPAPPR